MKKGSVLEQIIADINNADSNNKIKTIMSASAVTTHPFKERRRAEFFDVIGSSIEINTPDQFCKWAQSDLQHIFPHGMLICGIGQIETKGAKIHNMLSSNTPAEYMQTLQQNGGMSSSPVFAQWVKTRRPVLFELSEPHAQSAWLDNFKRQGLVNMATHGQCDLNSQSTSYFSFCKIPDRLTPRHASLLEMLIPHMHVALIRAFQGVKKETLKLNAVLPELTERETEILKWLGSGKTNWEIAQVLKISENTVKNHVQRILIKLKVNTRAQAVSKLLMAA